MPEPVPSFTTQDGKVHLDYEKAIRHDIEILLKRYSDNDVAGRRIVEAMNIASIEELINLLVMLKAELLKPSAFVVTRG